MEDVCPICHDTLQVGNTESLRPCNHVFHGQCIIEALRSSRNGRCPVCRDPGEHGTSLEDGEADMMPVEEFFFLGNMQEEAEVEPLNIQQM